MVFIYRCPSCFYTLKIILDKKGFLVYTFIMKLQKLYNSKTQKHVGYILCEAYKAYTVFITDKKEAYQSIKRRKNGGNINGKSRDNIW